jgi:predicted DNA-binding transcriptional regulator AlpA
MFGLRPDPDQPPDLLTSRQVADRLSVSVRTLWRKLARGTVPAPIRYNRKLVRWRTTDIEHYIATLTPSSGASRVPHTISP